MYLRIDQMVCRPGGDGIELMQCQVSPELKELLEKELEFGVNVSQGTVQQVHLLVTSVS